MIKVAIPLADASPADHIELKYSLRSIEAFYGPFHCFFIGTNFPDWFNSATGIGIDTVKDLPGPAEKENNIRRKFYACKSIVGNFLWSNDDFFITDKWDDSYLKCRGRLSETLRETQSPGYRSSVNNTIELIGEDWYDFDNHAPMWVDADKIYEYGKYPPYGYLHKTLYQWFSQNNSRVCICPDIKLRKRPTAVDLEHLEQVEYFSTSHAAITPAFVKWLNNKWPNKSRFEL